MTNIRCNSLAYPNGLYDSNTLEILNEINLDYGFTSKSGINYISDNWKEIKRIGMNASDSIYIVLLKIFINSIK